MTRPCTLVAAAALVGLLATPAQATPILDQTLIATGGDVVVTFVSNGAGYTSELRLDGAHAIVQNVTGPVLVGFEDMLGGGDLDYNDLIFAFTNVIAENTSGSGGGATTGAAVVDEPGTLLLLGSGLAMMGIAMRRRSVRR